MDTDQLEHDMNELCHEWMSGKAPTDGVFGPVQAATRVSSAKTSIPKH